MGTKNNPGEFDCYAAAHPGEPMFVLLARDKHAAALVNLWAAMKRLEFAQASPDTLDQVRRKVHEAERCANTMVEWYVDGRHAEPSGVRTLAEALAVLAEMCGAAVTIEQQPLQPLAMGHSVHRVNVRPKR